MTRYVLFFIVPLWLVGCVTGENAAPASMWTGVDEPAGSPDFNWQLAGDPRVAPLQVFDDRRRTWLQFATGQPVPALFAATAQGEVPLSYQRREPYIVVDAKWRTLIMRGGKLWARAQHARAPAPDAISRLPAHQDTVAANTASLDSPANLKPQSSLIAGSRVSAAASQFRADPTDGNMRRVLARWAQSSGWTFQAHHWAVDVDIPLAGSADFAGDFKSAVRELLAATELADRPVQPCFYANRVLRVVPWAQACDRSAAPGGAS